MLSRGEAISKFHYVGIEGGYRLHDHTLWQAFRTLFHWHNETMNVWTHLLGFVVCAVLVAHATSFAIRASPSGFGAPAIACAHSAEPATCLRELVLSSLSHEHLDELAAGLDAEHALAAQAHFERVRTVSTPPAKPEARSVQPRVRTSNHRHGVRAVLARASGLLRLQRAALIDSLPADSVDSGTRVVARAQLDSLADALAHWAAHHSLQTGTAEEQVDRW
jgi:hypothetical protein